MKLTKEHWVPKDISNFENFLHSLSQKEKIEWTKKIVNTSLPVLAIPTPQLKQICNEIIKGNYVDFLNLQIFSSHESTIIYGQILSKITDISLIKKYLKIYSKHVDSWATCDTLSFKVKGHEKNFWLISKELLHSHLPFERRIGIIILFKFVNNKYIKQIFQTIRLLQSENEYYVNMALSWLLCECYIKQRNETIDFISKTKINPIVMNKFISKCRDSFRVSKEDKSTLLKFKIHI